MVRTGQFHCRGPGSIPGWGTKIPQAEQYGQKKKKKKDKYPSSSSLSPSASSKLDNLQSQVVKKILE